MAQIIGATGVALPSPQALYPVTVLNQPQVSATNRLSLPPGGDVLIPPGRWLVSPGQYSFVQVLDPVTNTWVPYYTWGSNEPFWVESDGVNYRVINALGYPIGVFLNANGTGYTSAPTITAGGSGAGSGATFVAITGQAVNAININSAGSGANYAVPPIVNIAAPPSPGVPATAVCAISGGLIVSFTIVNPGAGYTSVPAVTIVPQATDLNTLSTSTSVITNAKATATISFNSQVLAVLLTNEGNVTQTGCLPMSSTGGAGSGVLGTIMVPTTITGMTATTPGSGYATPVGLMTFGGTITSGAATNHSPTVDTNLLYPRQVVMAATVGSGTGVQPGTFPAADGGIFLTPPSVIAIPGASSLAGSSAAPTTAVLTPVMGSVNDTVFITPT